MHDLFLPKIVANKRVNVLVKYEALFLVTARKTLHTAFLEHVVICLLFSHQDVQQAIELLLREGDLHALCHALNESLWLDYKHVFLSRFV